MPPKIQLQNPNTDRSAGGRIAFWGWNPVGGTLIGAGGGYLIHQSCNIPMTKMLIVEKGNATWSRLPAGCQVFMRRKVVNSPEQSWGP